MKSKVRRYRCVVADPSWPFDDKLPGKGRGAEKHYELMSVADICGLARGGPEKNVDYAEDPIPHSIAMCGRRFRLASDCVLFLWRVASMQREALRVIKAWGFELKTELVWIKTTHEIEKLRLEGAPVLPLMPTFHFGMGRITRAAHETCLIATRGKYSELILNHSTRSVFFAPVPRGPDGKIIHSAKPDAFYSIVEELCKGPRLELFARERREGWRCSGRELEP